MKEPIEMSLHKEDQGIDAEAIEIFGTIQKIMGDLKKKAAISERETVQLVQMVIGKALKKPQLRNEVICQLIKQTTST